MEAENLKERTKSFALGVARVVAALPMNPGCHLLGGQLLRAGTSVGANYRASCRAKSRADFIAKLKIVEEECDESLYWMELLAEIGHVNAKSVEALMSVGNQILSIIVASIRTARSHASRHDP